MISETRLVLNSKDFPEELFSAFFSGAVYCKIISAKDLQHGYYSLLLCLQTPGFVRKKTVYCPSKVLTFFILGMRNLPFIVLSNEALFNNTLHSEIFTFSEISQEKRE